MPVRFQSAEPFDAAASYASGQGPTISDVLKAYQIHEQAVSDRYQTQASVVSRDQASRQGGSELAMKLKYQEMGDRNEQASKITMTDAALAQRDNQAQLEANVRMQLQQGEFTQADKIRLDKYRYGKSQVQSELDAGRINMEQANDYLGQIRTGESMLQSKYKATQERTLAEKEQLGLRQAQTVAGLAVADTATKTQHIQSRIGTFTDPSTGKQHSAWINDKGEPVALPTGSGKSEDSLPEGAFKPQEFARIQEKAKRMTDAEIKRLTTGDDEAAVNNRQVLEADGGIRKKQMYENTLRDVFQVPPTYQQHLQELGGGFRSGSSSTQGQPQPAAQPAGQPQGGSPSSQAPAPVPVGKPFGKVEDAAPTQKMQLDSWDRLGSAAAASGAPDDMKKGYAASVKWAKDMLQQYGDPRAMPASDRKQYLAILDAMAPLTAPPAPPPPPQGPANNGYGSMGGFPVN